MEFFGWLLATVAAYWLVPVRLRQSLLILSTAIVLLAFDWRSLLALGSMTALVCVVTRARKVSQMHVLLAAAGLILLVLLVFKVLDSASGNPSMIDRFVPLGLSYYSLRCIHLLVECYLERIERPAIRQITAYLFFPATLVAGPIHRYPEFVAESQPTIAWTNISEAFERILHGYAKIVVLSNYLLSEKLFPWAMSSLDPLSAQYQYLDALDYGLNIYLQFSGYSDIAIGFALLLGHRVIENFSWPYLKSNISEFWRSWHISLTRLCREYVFTSVHAATRQAWLGVIATMLAISLWHGVSLNYLAWGIYHASGLVVYRAWSASGVAESVRSRLPAALNYFFGWFLTFQFVILGFVWTKEGSIEKSLDVFASFFRGVSNLV